MARKRTKDLIQCKYFQWLLGTRDNGVYYADGRSNEVNVGRHSLGTAEHQVARERIHRLDLVQAVKFGFADASLLQSQQEQLLPIEEGTEKYLSFASRPPVQGGITRSSLKRYRAVVDKFLEFTRRQKLNYWQQVDKAALSNHGRWLEDEDYAYATQYLELTTIKQIMGWLIAEKLLPSSFSIAMKLGKPRGTSTYCYSQAQVQAMVEHCLSTPDLAWLGEVIIALATTGLRIGELTNLRWSDVESDKRLLQLRDTTRRSKKSQRLEARSTKSHRDRALPIHPELQTVLVRLLRSPDGRVFHGPKGGKLKPDTVRNILRREVLTPLASRFPTTVEGPGIVAGRLHSFRHYFCSLSAQNRVPEMVLMSWLGHQDAKMIRHYYHQSEEGRVHMNAIPFIGTAGSAIKPSSVDETEA